MIADPSPILVCASRWRPRAGWSDTLGPVYVELTTTDVAGFDATRAWANVAMMMGDTHAAPLALICCLHAATLLPPGVEDRRLHAHRDLCLLDLGLATAPGPIRIATLGDPDTVDAPPSQLEAWLSRALIPFGGDLSRAAWFALRLAATRVGILDGPDPTP